jgi:hypothetical protein
LTATLAALIVSACGSAGGGAGSGYGGEEFGLTYRQLAERAEQVEAAIGRCMAEAGFEYVPVAFNTIREAMTSDKSSPGMSGSEFIRRFGFGITTQIDKPIVSIGRGEDNVRIVENLSEADRIAYLRTLYGDNPDATFAYGLEDEDFSRTGGCTREAIEQFFEPEELAATYMNPADALVEQDPRVQQALGDYAACMAKYGFDYSHPDDVEGWLWEQYDAIVGGGDIESLDPPELERLDQLRTTEIAVAGASQDCERRLLEPIVDEVEEELIG